MGTIRKLDGHYYYCIDIGCPDFEAAKRNREMVEKKLNIEGYLWIETLVRSYPRNKPLPLWFNYGKLPQAGKNETRELYQHGVIEVEKIDKGRK